MKITSHASCRGAQRGISLNSFDLIYKYGEARKRSGGVSELVITTKAAQMAIQVLKDEIKKIEKMKNKAFVFDGETLITTFHSTERYRYE
ncbi:hypothetical protein ACNQKP_10700 [Bdellovibrio bacteriovorus]|uniref:hypothetical protein n=1 Tax=Bdellovibrio bacteriovorus TaxID=959 RepID=UPI003AA8B86F